MGNGLTQRHTAKSLLVFAMPTIVMTVFMSLYTMVDGIFVANFVSADALAGLKLTGDTAVIVGKGDAGQVAKVIETFMKSSKDLIAPKAGFYEGALLSKNDVLAIAALPSKDALRAQLLLLSIFRKRKTSGQPGNQETP